MRKNKFNKEDGTTDSRVVLHLPAKLAPIEISGITIDKKRWITGIG